MTAIEFRKQLKANEELIETFVQLSTAQQQDLKPWVLALLKEENSDFQKQQLALCGLMSFSLNEYVTHFKLLPEYYFEEKQYQKYRPAWFQEYIDSHLKNKKSLKLETIADLINNYSYVFKDSLILVKLIYLDTEHEINPRETFEKTVVSLLTTYPKFTKQHIKLLFTEDAENYLNDGQSRSWYQNFYIEIDSWVKIIYKLYESEVLDRASLIRTCLYLPLKNLNVNTRIWIFKLFSKVRPTLEELQSIEKELFSAYEGKNLQLIKNAFSQPELDAKLLKELFLPELRYAIDENLNAKKVLHQNKLPSFEGFTTIEATCEILNAMTTLNAHTKTAYIPLTKSVDAEHSVHSKLGGLPYLLHENDYPKCSNCGKRLQLLLQLNLEDFPAYMDKGLVQVFFCTNPNTNCESKLQSKNSTTSLSRTIDDQGNSATNYPNMEYIFPEKRITEFVAFTDYPHREDYERLGIELQVPEDIYDYMQAHVIGTTNAHDKLFGHPCWLQSSAFSDSPEQDDNHLLFQIASNDNLPFMFGDSGIGYVLRNTNNRLLFTWQGF